MEKTFEELIEESDYSFTNDGNDTLMHDVGILELLQQVVEATIEEVVKIGKEKLGIMGDSTFIKAIRALPTDRITIKD